ncbi:MAG TPA: peroxiredoxin, partial [Vicinamibacteria bacterium]|nr:peroxiredoxin [Vicinamibacteria bacterium]
MRADRGMHLWGAAGDGSLHEEDKDRDRNERKHYSIGPMPLIEPGKKAPAFALKDQAGKTHRLSEYAGRPVILYFYPKDDTPGCTKEACAFQAGLPKFKPR